MLVHVHVWSHKHVETWRHPQLLFLKSHAPYCSETRSHTEYGAHQVCQAVWSVSSRVSSVSAPSALRLQGCSTMHIFLSEFWRPNSGPYACKVRTLNWATFQSLSLLFEVHSCNLYNTIFCVASFGSRLPYVFFSVEELGRPHIGLKLQILGLEA